MSYELWVMKIKWRKLSDKKTLPKQALNVFYNVSYTMNWTVPFSKCPDNNFCISFKDGMCEAHLKGELDCSPCCQDL